MKILIPKFSPVDVGLDSVVQELGHDVISGHHDDLNPQVGDRFLVPRRVDCGMGREEYLEYLFEVYGIIISECAIDLILPTPSLHDISVIIGQLNRTMNLPGLDDERMKLLVDKARYLGTLRDGGFPHLAHRYGLIRPGSDEVSFQPDFPCILKPAYGCGGAGVFVAQNQEQFDWFLGEGDEPKGQRSFYQDRFDDGRWRTYMFVSGGGNYIVEQYLEGDVVSVAGVVSQGRAFCDMIYDIEVTDPPVQSEIGFHYPSKHDVSDVPEIINRACEILRVDKGPFMADLIRQPDGSFALIDFGPRMSSSAIHLSRLADNPSMVRRVIESVTQPDLSDLEPVPEVSMRALMFPKGKVLRVEVPFMPDVITEGIPESGTQVFEARNDHQVLQRGVAFSSGSGCRERTLDFVNRTTVMVS